MSAARPRAEGQRSAGRVTLRELTAVQASIPPLRGFRRPGSDSPGFGTSPGQASKRRCRRAPLITRLRDVRLDRGRRTRSRRCAWRTTGCVVHSTRLMSPLARMQFLPDCGEVVVAVAPIHRVARDLALGERLLEIRAKRVVVRLLPIRRHGFPCIARAVRHPADAPGVGGSRRSWRRSAQAKPAGCRCRAHVRDGCRRRRVKSC